MTALTHPPAAPPPFDWIDPPDGKLYELLDGLPVEKQVSVLAIATATRVSHLLMQFIDPRGLGHVLVKQPLVGVWGKPNHNRRPDVCYVSRQKLPTLPEEGELTVVPDLVVEVVSPNEHAGTLEDKVQDYLRIGVPLIWVVHPPQKSAHVHRADATGRILAPNATLDGETILPGFTCPVADLFPKT